MWLCDYDKRLTKSGPLIDTESLPCLQLLVSETTDHPLGPLA